MELNVRNKNLVKIVGGTIGCVLFFGLGWFANSRLNKTDYQLIETAHKLILEDSFYNEQSSRELTYAAIRGMLDDVDDPYSELIEPEAAEALLDTFAGKTGVVGLFADKQGDHVEILNIHPGGPAEKAGLKVGDVILAIDGIPLDDQAGSSETGLLIRGDPGTAVVLEIERQGAISEYKIIREERVFVTYRMLPEGVGYFTLSAFNDVASEKMGQAIKELLGDSPAALVWDLRNNEGGDMFAAKDILSYFIDEGLLFTAELTRGRIVEFKSTGKTLAADIPLAVLIDQSTYSAAETCAAAIAETGRGVTVGNQSYGKGLIQATIPMKDNVLLQMTIARWLSTDGGWYHERGVEPQVKVVDNPNTEIDEVLQRAIEFLLSE